MRNICLLFLAMRVCASSAETWTIERVAGTGQPERGEVAGAALEVNIGQPFGVEIGPDGWLYVTEVENHRVLRCDPDRSGAIECFAGSGEKGCSGDGGAATDARLNEPYEIRFLADGTAYFVEMRNHLVRRVATNGVISTVAGTGEEGFGGDGGPATEAAFSKPHSIAIHEARGHLYIADIGNHRVRRLDLASGRIETYMGTGARKPPVAGRSVRGMPVVGPRALYIRGDTMWLALREGHSVWAIDLGTDVIRHVAGTGKRGYSGDGGPATEATFNGPKGVAVDAAGHVFVVDTENQAIRRIDAATGVITSCAGFGPTGRGYNGDGIDAATARMDRPHGCCVDARGRVYIGDTNNHRVRRLTK